MRPVRPGAVLAATMLTILAGCGKPDWIDRTLVTVDVTGNWYGQVRAFEISLALQQDGPKVKGSVRVRGLSSGASVESGSIDGTISGDTFSFKQNNGSAEGVLSVSGDEMQGQVSATSLSTNSYPADSRIILHRTSK